MCYNYLKQIYYLRGFMSSSTPITSYTHRVALEEFIDKEAKKVRANTFISEGTVSLVRKKPLPSLDAIKSIVAHMAEPFDEIECNPTLMREKFSSRMSPLKPIPLPIKSSARVASAAKLDGDKIAEALLSELAITTADDARPIVATYGCGPCVAVGGYDSTNKIAFVVHFTGAGEVIDPRGLVFSNILKLVKTSISSPIQLHLRGGYKGQSEATVEAIKVWMRQREDLPMEIASADILTSSIRGIGKSLSIDSRTGEVSEYNPMSNAKRRDFSGLDAIIALRPKITLAYSPK